MDDVHSRGLAASSGVAPRLTTYNARTFLQPQLQKASRAAEKKVKGDYNPKDFLVFSPSAFNVAEYGRDNTGERAYDEELVMPTLRWPSDHGLVYTTLVPLDAAGVELL